MRRRKWLLIVTALALLGVAGFFLFLWATSTAPVSGVTLENFRRLRVGMSSSEVEGLLGKPQKTLKRDWENWDWTIWPTKEVAIYLLFDRDLLLWFGKASRPGQDGKPDCIIEFLQSTEPTGFLDRNRSWLNSPKLDNPDAAHYHEERPYIMFAIAAGVLAILLWVYCKRRKLPSSPK
jgi:hypothetical protein